MTHLEKMTRYWEGEFTEHKAEIKHEGRIIVISWATPGTNINSVIYIMVPDRGLVFVSGDLGEAVYRWQSQVNLELLAGCGLSYFQEKCTASESGRGYWAWDPREGIKSVRENVAIWSEDHDEDESNPWETRLEEMVHRIGDGSREEWVAHLIDMEGFWNLGTEELSALADAGRVPHTRVIAHWLGLKMAHGQLSAPGMEQEAA